VADGGQRAREPGANHRGVEVVMNRIGCEDLRRVAAVDARQAESGAAGGDREGRASTLDRDLVGRHRRHALEHGARIDRRGLGLGNLGIDAAHNADDEIRRGDVNGRLVGAQMDHGERRHRRLRIGGGGSELEGAGECGAVDRELHGASTVNLMPSMVTDSVAVIWDESSRRTV
jgi:hypothetical protein